MRAAKHCEAEASVSKLAERIRGALRCHVIHSL